MQHLTPNNPQPYQGFSYEESKLIMSKSTGLMKCWSHLAFNTGMSASELVAIKVSDVDFRDDTLTTKEGIVYYLSKKTIDIVYARVDGYSFSKNDFLFNGMIESINKNLLQPLLDRLNIKGSLDSFEQTLTRFTHPQYGKEFTRPAKSNVSVTSEKYIPLSTREPRVETVNDVLFGKKGER